MKKIKEYWFAVVVLFAGVISVISYFLSKNRSKVNELSAKVDLVQTQKEADLLEVEIKDHLYNVADNTKAIEELQSTLDNLDIRRKELKNRETHLTDSEVEDFWNNKQGH